MKKIAVFFVIAAASCSLAFLPNRQVPTPAKINWLTIEEAYAKNLKEPRKFMIDVYTDWCGWCKVMDKNTFSDQRVIEYVNKKYYAVKLDAESQKLIKLGEKSFKFVPQGNKGYNEFAAVIMNGQMSFPTVVFMDEKFMNEKANQLFVIQAVPGYHEPGEYHQIITFFGDNHHTKQTTWESFTKEIYPKSYPKKL